MAIFYKKASNPQPSSKEAPTTEDLIIFLLHQNIGQENCVQKFTHLQEDISILKEIVEKTKQVVFARGLKRQKEFVEDFPIYKAN